MKIIQHMVEKKDFCLLSFVSLVLVLVLTVLIICLEKLSAAVQGQTFQTAFA